LTAASGLPIVALSPLNQKVGMIRRVLVLLALFTLTLVSAATAHEHGMRHAVAAPIEATVPAPVVLPAATVVADHVMAWLAVPDVSNCADTSNAHHHGKVADCACPAACVGLFGVATAEALPPATDSTGKPAGFRRLVSMPSAPPTPPPRA